VHSCRGAGDRLHPLLPWVLKKSAWPTTPPARA